MGSLDGGKLLFEAPQESGFFGDLVAGLLDELGGGFVDVVGVHHASIQGVKFATDGEDAFLEAGLVFGYNISGDVEIEFVADQRKAQAARLTFATDNTADAGKFGGEELIIVDEGIVAIKEIPLLAFPHRKFLQEGADFGDDSDKIVKLGGGNFIIFEAGRPLGSDEETVGPAERLPNRFGDERSKRMEHLQNHLESNFEEREILVDLLAF